MIPACIVAVALSAAPPVPSDEAVCRLFTAGISDVIGASARPALGYRARSMTFHDRAHAGSGELEELEEVVGRFELRPEGLVVGELRHATVDSVLQEPRRSTTWYDLRSGDVAHRTSMPASISPMVLLGEWSEIPAGVRYLLGRAEPLPPGAALLGVEPDETGLADRVARHVLPDHGTVTLWFDVEPPALRRIERRDPERRLAVRTDFLPAAAAAATDVVAHPRAVVSRRFDAAGHVRAVQGWFRVEDAAALDPLLQESAPWGAEIVRSGPHGDGGTRHATRTLPLAEVAPWTFAATAPRPPVQSETSAVAAAARTGAGAGEPLPEPRQSGSWLAPVLAVLAIIAGSTLLRRRSHS